MVFPLTADVTAAPRSLSVASNKALSVKSPVKTTRHWEIVVVGVVVTSVAALALALAFLLLALAVVLDDDRFGMVV